ncbi:MAG: protein translocase subunit SecD [Nitrospirae bacterium]|nr:protein translocase subunit SecD [Nitrospirota bacterium]
MKKKFFWRVLLITTTTLLSVIFFLPSTQLFLSMPEWLKKTLPEKGITLGLDLQGGLHLVFEVEGDKAVDLTMEKIAVSLKDILDKKGFKADVKKDASGIAVFSSDINIRKVVEDNYPALTLSDSSEEKVIYKLSGKEAENIKNTAVEQAIETIRNRIDQFGVTEPTIQRQGTNEIVVQLPGVKDTRRAVDIVGKTALLEFKLLDEESPMAAQLPAEILPGDEDKLMQEFGSKIPEGDSILTGRVENKETGKVSKRVYLIKNQTLMTGDTITEARVNIDTRLRNEPIVSITFNAVGAKLFEDITSANVKKRLAIILDNNVYSAPVIQERIEGGKAQISGAYGFNLDEATDLAIVLRAGSLPAPLEMIQNVTVGPSLGRDSINAGIKAGIIGSILVIAFMIFYYRISGLIADAALILNIIMLLGALSMFNATLTLPGIAGIILAIGMAVDSNVLMFERMRDELRLGKTPRAAVDSGYNKAFWTIFDSHVTTLITAAVLFQFGTGPIKGFAVTLSLGVAINLYTALIGTKLVFDVINSRTEVKKLSI